MRGERVSEGVIGRLLRGGVERACVRGVCQRGVDRFVQRVC